MSLVIGDLVGLINADDSGMRRGLSDAELRMRGFQRDTEGRLRTLSGRFASLGEQAAMGFEVAGREGRQFSLDLRSIGAAAASAARSMVPLALTAAKLGAAVPMAAGLATTLAQVAPAAAVAVSGMLAIKMASAAVKIGVQGMDDALKAAFDPEKAEEFEKALKNLSPSAAAFAREVKTLVPQWKALQQNVQEQLFRGLAENLSHTATAVLPVLRTELSATASALGNMAAGAMGAARDLADEGILGQALAGARKGLENLEGVPGMIVRGLGQIAAAAGPSFGVLTEAAAHGMAQLSSKMDKAFASGRMQQVIEQAFDQLNVLLDVLGNVISIVGSMFKAASANGGGLLGVLRDITDALAAAFAGPEIQAGLKALFQTMATIGKVAAPLLVDVLKVVAGVFAELGGPVQTLVRALGAALGPVIKALGPVLAAAARAVGSLLTAVAPLLPLLGELVAAVLPLLTPLLDAVTVVFAALAPVIADVADILRRTLTPILAALPGIIGPLAKVIGEQFAMWLGVVGDILVALGPSLVILGEALGELLVALTPLIEAWGELSTELLTALMPILQPLIELVGKLATYLAKDLARTITDVVVPAIKSITAFLKGDFSGAAAYAKEALRGFVENAIRRFTELPRKAAEALTRLALNLRQKAVEAGGAMLLALRGKLDEAVRWLGTLPGRARATLGNLGGVLWGAGQSLINGLISGIYSKFESVRSALSSLTSMLPDWKGPAQVDAKILTPAGRSLIEGFQAGISAATPGLRDQLGGLTGSLPGMVPVPAGGAPAGGPTRIVVELAGPAEMRELIRSIVQKTGGTVEQVFGHR